MKKLTNRYRNVLHLFSMNKTLSIIFPIVLSVSLNVNAEESSEVIEDCGEVEIRYSDSPELTRAERIALMEKAFFDSVNRFESCNLSDPNNTSATGSDGGDQGGGENQAGNAGNSSVASQEMQGTEPETETESSMPAQAGTADSDEPSENEGGSVVSSGGADNGAIPEDIPSANNDDAIAAQIRLAAEAEQDPEIKKKLWNEYRKYKGMNIVED
ncbi:hypothetical protein [uncultured Methylophaga sp.]|uniref:hypothetical protein n=1 Tax=uncultured Methylophaga sp. TaxID=285271 RepID=UPI0030D89DE7|tara:strand:- start:4075 stop:4716 length:642 start_codon:yes stop_codon:yes gene_type:complete